MALVVRKMVADEKQPVKVTVTPQKRGVDALFAEIQPSEIAAPLALAEP